MYMNFGYVPAIDEALSDGARIAWGARAIWQRGSVDILPDRQSWYGPSGDDPVERKQFASELNKILRVAWLRARELYDTVDDFGADGAGVYTLYDDDKICITASPNASYGYLYIAAVPVLPDQSQTRDLCRCGF